jgi:hypothetical protein
VAKKPVAPVAQAPVLAPSTPPLRPQSILDPDAEPFVLSEAEAVPSVLPSAALGPSPVEDAGWYRIHCQQGHPYDARCDCCVRGRLKARPAKKIKPADRAAGDGYVMSADFTGIHDPDLDGHRVALVATVHSYGSGTDSEAAFGFVALLVDRKTATVASALDDFDVQLTRLGSDKTRSVIRFHTDVD